MSISSTEDQATYAVERHSIDYVSSAERHGRVRDQGPFWFTVNFQFMSVSLGFVGPRWACLWAGRRWPRRSE